MSHDVKRIRLEVYDINLDSVGGPSARATVQSPIVRPVLTFLGIVCPSTPKKTDYEP